LTCCARPLRTALDRIRAGHDRSTDNTATRNRIRDTVFALSLQAAGFTLSDMPPPCRVDMFEPNDVVIETVTGQKLHAHSDCYFAPAFNRGPRRRAISRPMAAWAGPSSRACAGG
jgi:hypothetical protein